MPWWNARATRYLAASLRPGDRVFEWGSGASTAWLAAHGALVTSVEHDPAWAARALERCPGTDIRVIPGTDEGAVRSEPQLNDGGVHFFDGYVAAIDAYDDSSFDVVVVDGICRMECVRRAVPKVRPGGLLVVDDTDFRFLAPRRLLPGWAVTVKAGFKTRTEVRETSFFRKPG